jgi:glutamine amidotransferase
MNRVAIIDYGMGNLDSVARAVEECGGVPVITDSAEKIGVSNRIILPGVGAFFDGMQNLRSRSLDEILREQVMDRGIPLLGICLGMQLLATRGWEGGETMGLGWFGGEVRRFEPHGENVRIPHIGWNEVVVLRESPLFRGVPSGKDFYFDHSYHFCASDDGDLLARTPYCGWFPSAIERGGVFGVQFHPEKSQRAGFQVLRNFLAL